MPPKSHPSIAILALAWLALPVAAADYHDPNFGYSISLPDDWVPLTDAELVQVNAEMLRQKLPVGGLYARAFRLKSKPVGELPMIFTLWKPPVPRESFETFRERVIAAASPAAVDPDLFPGLFRDATFEVVGDDPDTARVQFLANSTAAAGPVRSLATLHLGVTGSIGIFGRAARDDFPAHEFTFRQVHDSFRFAPGRGFRATVGRIGGAGAAQLILGLAVCLAGPVLVIVGIVLLLVKSNRPPARRPRRRPRRDDAYDLTEDDVA